MSRELIALDNLFWIYDFNIRLLARVGAPRHQSWLLTEFSASNVSEVYPRDPLIGWEEYLDAAKTLTKRLSSADPEFIASDNIFVATLRNHHDASGFVDGMARVATSSSRHRYVWRVRYESPLEVVLAVAPHATSTFLALAGLVVVAVNRINKARYNKAKADVAVNLARVHGEYSELEIKCLRTLSMGIAEEAFNSSSDTVSKELRHKMETASEVLSRIENARVVSVKDFK